MFQFACLPPLRYVFTQQCYGFTIAGFPIQTLQNQRLLTAPLDLSWSSTSFIGSWYLGIPRVLFVA
jgi:hypothetical protein